MRRREFITLLGSAAAAWPLAARAQPVPVAGILGSYSPEKATERLRAFRDGLADAGYMEGRNLLIESRFANEQYDRLPALAAELVRKQVSLIAALGNLQPVLAAKSATTTIPIVFAMGADPVQTGLVASLNRPGGNITGITQTATILVSKRIQLLHDLVPNAKAFGILINPSNVRESTVEEVRAAIRAFGGTTEVAAAKSEGDFDAAFASLAQKRVQALVTLPESLFSTRAQSIAALAARYAIPTIYGDREAPLAGGLISYGTSIPASYRQVGVYAGRILRGEKPADLPIMQPTKFDLVVNLKAAKALGLDVPPLLLAIADGVIE